MINSNEDDRNKRRDRAVATLALGIQDQEFQAVLPVSDDDLLAFHQNQLSTERRDQVMHSIANDNNTYNRWIDLVQTMELLDELEREDIEAEKGTGGVEHQPRTVQPTVNSSDLKKWDLVGRFGSWLKIKRGWTGTFGKGAGVALAAVLAVFVVPKMITQPSVNGLYDQYSISGSALLPDKSLSFSKDRDKPYSVTETELAMGIVSGFDELDVVDLPSSWKVKPDLYVESSTNPNQEDESVHALGRLVALSLVQCKVAKDEVYFQSAAPLIQKLSQQHGISAPELAVAGDAREEVCSKADAIVNQLQ